jgi:hypothetical protein
MGQAGVNGGVRNSQVACAFGSARAARRHGGGADGARAEAREASTTTTTLEKKGLISSKLGDRCITRTGMTRCQKNLLALDPMLRCKISTCSRRARPFLSRASVVTESYQRRANLVLPALVDTTIATATQHTTSLYASESLGDGR